MKLRALVLASVIAAGTLGTASSSAHDPCTLVFSAYPGEIDALLTSTTITSITNSGGWTFYAGTLDDRPVVLSLTGIGLVNAEGATRTALDTFGCIDTIVFSGVAGGKTFIGDVIVPARWSIDDGGSFVQTDPDLLAIASGLNVPLAEAVPLGDLACVGVDPNLVAPITLPHTPALHIGGDGKSADPFGGRAFPCVPGGGDVFGCDPCRGPLVSVDVDRFASRAVPFIDPDFFLDYFQQPPPSSTDWAAEDMETAAVAAVAAEFDVPFIAFRGVSDGQGDQLNLPGFPFQFFVYRQIAANNAAAVTRAFLDAQG